MLMHKTRFIFTALILSTTAIGCVDRLRVGDLPGQIVVYDANDREYMRYTGNWFRPFVPLDPQPTEPLFDIVHALEPGAEVSPDGKWRVGPFDDEAKRWTVAGPDRVKHRFEHFSVTPTMDWSPDGQYIVYAVDGQDSKLAGQIFVMDLGTGESYGIGKGGYIPRWLPDDVVLEGSIQE